MKDKSVECEVERLLAVIGGKWKVLILRELFAGPKRHADLRRALSGITQKVLTAQLRELELDGAIQRKDLGTSRPHVEYSLTQFGRQLQDLVLAMHQLALKNCESLKRRPAAGRFERARSA
jgi:DNA-binding HxlR family transcriptional regulator